MGTATEAPQVPETFRERVKGLKRKDLAEIAQEEFQLTIDDKVKEHVLRDTLIRAHEDRVASAMEQNQAASNLFLERDKNEKLLTVQFLPLDFPNNPEKFSYDGGYGIRDRKNPKRNPTGLSKMANFFLIPGQTYQLPLCVIKHLEKLVFMDSKPEFDTTTGMIAGNKPIIKQRFLLRLVASEQVLADMGTRKFT